MAVRKSSISFCKFTEKVEVVKEESIFDTLYAQPTKERLLNFYKGGIAVQSIYEVYCKYIQKFVYNIEAVEKLMNTFCQYSKLDKVLLFDVPNKYLICGDNCPLDEKTYAFCLDVVLFSVKLAENFDNIDDSVGPIDRSFECVLPYKRNIDNRDCHIIVKGINKYLAFVFLFQEIDSSRSFKNIIEQNFNCMCDSFNKIINLNKNSLV